jgi:hypothetical protein
MEGPIKIKNRYVQVKKRLQLRYRERKLFAMLRAARVRARKWWNIKVIIPLARMHPLIKKALLFNRKHQLLRRGGFLVAASLMLFVVFFDALTWRWRNIAYELSPKAAALLDDPMPQFAEKLVYNMEQDLFTYNEGYTPNVDGAMGEASRPRFSATFYGNPRDGLAVKDVVHTTELPVKPKFRLDQPRQDVNRLIYPLFGHNGAKVITLKANSIKEDIVLESFSRDEVSFKYELALPAELEARMEEDGSVGVYGTDSVFLGEISTGSDQDAQLLEQLREKADKTVLLFRIPAPFVVETGRNQSVARAWFSLKDNELTIHASNLSEANYPLSIDPSIYVETASKLMRGNNESNIDFNVDNELIQKGSTTGARFDDWLDTTQLNDGRAFAATAVAGGYIYTIGGSEEGGLVSTVYDTSGTETYTVPSGVTSVNIKAWGGGGGGGGASVDRIGGNGAGGGYSSSTITVTPAEDLTIRIGGGGGGGAYTTSSNSSGNGGGGGGYSGVLRSGTPLLIAGGGGGGGGGNGDSSSPARAPGSNGGPGGASTGQTGSGNGSTTGGNGGTQSAGGGGGTANGSNGLSLQGGAGGSQGAAVTVGGTHGGGNGGTHRNSGANRQTGGGGGGGGYYGGGGGGRSNNIKL